MRIAFLAALVLGFAVVSPDRGLAQQPGTPSELADDALAVALWRIAAATHTQIGFESIDFIRQGRSLDGIPTLPVSSRDDALKATVDANPRYEWRAIGDFVVVRPKTAWNDGGNPLNRRVSNLRVEHATDSGALAGLREVLYTRRFAALPNPGKPVAFDVQSGTVLDAFNQLIQSADDVLWHAAYRPNARSDQRSPSWDLQLQLYDATGQRGGLASCSALPCAVKRCLGL